MWVIAGLLLISFALFFFGKIAKTRGITTVLVLMGIAVWWVAVFHTWKEDYTLFFIILGFLLLSGPSSDLIAIPILRRRVIPPCVRVKRHRAGIYNIILLFFVIAFVISLLATESFRSPDMIIFSGLITVSMIIFIILFVFGKIEICGNGVWLDERFYRWQEFESFYWKGQTKDGLELRLVSKSWLCRTTRLMARPEDREAMQQLLEANLPDLTL